MLRMLWLVLMAAPLGAQMVAFENVNVIPMDRERVLERQTVVVRNGLIVQVGPAARTKTPSEAVRVSGDGKYLVPGFAEMHGHLPNPDTPPQVTEAVLALYVANGVTTVRGMLGHPNHLDLRHRIAEGKLLGPTLRIAGPAIGGPNVTPEQAASMVREQKAAGYDHIKVQEGLRPETYDALVAAAKAVKIDFVGHVPDRVGLLRALEAGQKSIDHMDNYLDALEHDDSPLRNADPKVRARELALHIDESKIPSLATATRKAGAWVVPTMALWETFNSTESPESLATREELKYVPRQWAEQWKKQKAAMLANANPEAGRRVIEVRRKMLRALNESGVKIIFGTDSPQVFSVPGFSIHREIPIMLASGMTPFQVLASGTRNVAQYFGARDCGTVETGKRADLILLDGNPLSDLSVLAHPAGVMVRGRWMPRGEIRRKLDEIAAMNSR